MPPTVAADALAVADWRRRTAEAYARVRRIAVDDPAGAHAVWVQARDELFAEHPASPLDAATRASFAGLDVARYDPAFRFEVDLRAAPRQRLDVTTGTDGVVPFERIGSVELPGIGSLAVWALRSYGGGLFLPVRDLLAGVEHGTYGGGRYVLDTIKGADLGTVGGRLVVDLNFAYNPSCAYDPAWACPLATRVNTVDAELPVGERVWVPRAWDDERSTDEGLADVAAEASDGPAGATPEAADVREAAAPGGAETPRPAEQARSGKRGHGKKGHKG